MKISKIEFQFTGRTFASNNGYDIYIDTNHGKIRQSINTYGALALSKELDMPITFQFLASNKFLKRYTITEINEDVIKQLFCIKVKTTGKTRTYVVPTGTYMQELIQELSYRHNITISKMATLQVGSWEQTKQYKLSELQKHEKAECLECQLKLT